MEIKHLFFINFTKLIYIICIIFFIFKKLDFSFNYFLNLFYVLSKSIVFSNIVTYVFIYNFLFISFICQFYQNFFLRKLYVYIIIMNFAYLKLKIIHKMLKFLNFMFLDAALIYFIIISNLYTLYLCENKMNIYNKIIFQCKTLNKGFIYTFKKYTNFMISEFQWFFSLTFITVICESVSRNMEYEQSYTRHNNLLIEKLVDSIDQSDTIYIIFYTLLLVLVSLPFNKILSGSNLKTHD